MNHNFSFTDVNDALPTLAFTLLCHGDEFGSRAGRTLELMHVGITLYQPWQREIVLPERKANLAAQIYETMWVLSGRNDVAGLSNYLPRAGDFSDDGETWRAGYGPRLRDWHGVDQLAYIVDTLRASSGSRQAVAMLWDPSVDTTPGKDISCNNWLSFSSREGSLDLHVGIRSNDFIWGWSGINAFEWSALQEIVAAMLGLMVGSLHFSTTSFHLYDRHWEKARLLARQDGNFRYSDSPRFDAVGLSMDGFDYATGIWFKSEELIRTGQFVDVDAFPEPMMRSWLRVLQWYWSGDVAFLEPLAGTRLYHAALVGIKPAGKPQELTAYEVAQANVFDGTVTEWLSALKTPNWGAYRDSCAGGFTGTYSEWRRAMSEPAPTKPDFLTYVNALHTEKHAAYGDSWKRRGEPGILGNIARKIDRIGSGADTSDETQADTAIDLLVYLAKYRCWLVDHSGDPLKVAQVLAQFEGEYHDPINLVDDFAKLETLHDSEDKIQLADIMLEKAFTLAESRWS